MSINISSYHQYMLQSMKNFKDKSLNLNGKTEIERALKAGFNLLVHVTAPLKDDLKLISETGTSCSILSTI